MNLAEELRGGWYRKPDEAMVRQDIERITSRAVSALAARCWRVKDDGSRIARGYFKTWSDDNYLDDTRDFGDKFILAPGPNLS